MSQEKFELKDILGNLKPRILEGSFVFTTSNDELDHLMKTFKPIATFREEEGITLVISKDDKSGISKSGIISTNSFAFKSLPSSNDTISILG